jgi:hypothetical protein
LLDFIGVYQIISGRRLRQKRAFAGILSLRLRQIHANPYAKWGGRNGDIQEARRRLAG